MFVTTSESAETTIDCISDFASGKAASPYSSIYVFDKGHNIIHNLNISYPKNIEYPGAFHNGMHPLFIELRFIQIKFYKEDTSYAMYPSLCQEGTSTIEYCNIEQSHADSYGILIFSYGTSFLDHLNIIDSSGSLTYFTYTPKSVTIINCYINSNAVQTNTVSIQNEQSSLIQFLAHEICDFVLDSAISCQKHSKNISPLRISLLFFTLWL